MSTQADTFELIQLEEIWGEDLKCESQHLDENRVCSGLVTHVVYSCTPPWHVCSASAGWYRIWAAEGWDCDDCGEMIAECWRIVPI